MKKPKKHARDLTTDEVMHRLFPKRLVDDLKDCAHERAGQGKQGGSTSRPKK